LLSKFGFGRERICYTKWFAKHWKMRFGLERRGLELSRREILRSCKTFNAERRSSQVAAETGSIFVNPSSLTREPCRASPSVGGVGYFTPCKSNTV
jgi:hypothetical protein